MYARVTSINILNYSLLYSESVLPTINVGGSDNNDMERDVMISGRGHLAGG